MKYFLPLFILTQLLIGCVGVKKTGSSTVSGDGSSYETAIYINETNEMSGVKAEYAWLNEHYPGYKRNMQSLANHNGKPYDIIKIKTAAGDDVTVYFDISNFFGK
ncbi:MAG: hypothetical protein ACHQF2_06005 [Flavobacteriales bacterium]